MRGGKERVGGYGLAVAGLGGEFIVRCSLFGVRCKGCGFEGCWTEGFEGQAEVVEDLGVVGSLGVEAGEDFKCGGEVAGGQRGVGLLDEGGLRSGFAAGVGEVLRGERAGDDESGEEQGCRATHPRIAMRRRCMGHPHAAGLRGWRNEAVLRVGMSRCHASINYGRFNLRYS